jgi:catechol 2,3-dioxygenase-like lactoylglutathione lyase family enzyme
VRLDHVIFATADLDAAAARVHAELGLRAVAARLELSIMTVGRQGTTAR